MPKRTIVVCGASEIDSRLAKLREDVVVCSIVGSHKSSYKTEFEDTILPGLRRRNIGENRHLVLTIDDVEMANIDPKIKCAAPSIRHIHRAFAFLDNHKSSDILMHCQLGLSRSPALCIAYLARTYGIGKEVAAGNDTTAWRNHYFVIEYFIKDIRKSKIKKPPIGCRVLW